MSDVHTIIEFAVLGHPNEGKSSLVSTLTEDDSVNVSAFPGETTVCRVFPVIIDGLEIIRFTDTPGFQSPRQTLEWFKDDKGPRDTIIKRFRTEQKDNPTFRDEIELFGPVDRGAGIIYVADGSRPLRRNDLAEMEILAISGRPRIAVINNKNRETRHIPRWEQAFNDFFPKVIQFNAHNASYQERIFLLTQLSGIHRDFKAPVDQVIEAFKKDWDHRNALVSETILTMVENCLTHFVRDTVVEKSLKEQKKAQLMNRWNKEVAALEIKAHQNIRKRFKHNIFNIHLPEHSILSRDLFDSETWRVLGLSKGQLAAAAATVGGAAAMVFDLALAGHSLGLITLLGSAAGAGTALLGSKKIARTRFLGKTLGGYSVKVGPHRDIRFMFILLDRALLFYTHIINWAHGKREDGPGMINHSPGFDTHEGFTAKWPKETRNVFLSFFSILDSKKEDIRKIAKKNAMGRLKKILDDIPFRGSGKMPK